MLNKKLLLIVFLILSTSFCGAINACATTWYVRDGGGNASQCTGTTNAVYPGSGSSLECALNSPMAVLGYCTGNEDSGAPCQVPPLMQSGDTLYVVGDSDLNPGQQAQYEVGFDDVNNGALTPGCNIAYASACQLGPVPGGISATQLTSIIGIGTHQPQIWGTQGTGWVLNATSGNYDIENLELTQHSSCSAVISGMNPGYNGFPGACAYTGGSYPYGPWVQVGLYLSGSNITTKNLWIHRIGKTAIFFPGNVTNWNSTNDKITSAGAYLTDGGSMTFGGNNTLTNDVWAFGGCAEKYPTPDPGNVRDLNNYLNCADQNAGGAALGGGLAMQYDGNAACGNWTISDTQFLFNLKSNLDFLHCNGTGTFNFYRSRSEGASGEALKLNVAQVNIESSQLIGNAPVWTTPPFQAILAPYSYSNAAWSPIVCRGGAVTLFATNPGEQVNVINSDVEGNCSALLETGNLGSASGYTCPGMAINSKNSKYIAGYDYFANRGNNVDLLYNGGNDGNGSGLCGTNAVPLNQNNNSVYNENDPQDCIGGSNLCGVDPKILIEANASLPSVVGPTAYYSGTAFGDQLYLQASSPLKGAGTTSVTFSNGSSNDYNNFPLNNPPDIGAVQYNSCIQSNSFCSISGQCCGGNTCNSEGQCGSGSAAQPVAAITAPSDGSSFAVGSNITISATASEVNGNIANLSIYNGSSLLASGTSSPLNFVMNNAVAGTYTFTAVATDGNGVSVTSNPVAATVTASSNAATSASPVVTITSPANGSTFAPGSNITLTANASETNGSIANVSFYYNGNNFLGTSTTPPYTYTANSVQAGNYTVTAVATDANGVSTTSSIVSVIVSAASNAASAPSTASSSPLSKPVVSLTSPGNGSTFTAGSNVTITANASETNGNIASVSFYYNGNNLLGTSTASPYEYIATNVSAGSYIVTAVATDANGVSTTSSPVSVTVTAPTTTPSASSSSKLLPEVVLTSPSNGSTFTAGSNVTITANASETNGNIASVSFYYNGNNLLGTSTASPYEYIATNVSAGSYIVTAVATDANGVSTTSSPVSVTVTAPSAPSVSSTTITLPEVVITSPSNGSSFTAGANITVSANASETNGSIASVSFYYNGNNLLGTFTTPPYSYIATNVQAGVYTVTAVATDANGGKTTSSPISVTVSAPVTEGTASSDSINASTDLPSTNGAPTNNSTTNSVAASNPVSTTSNSSQPTDPDADASDSAGGGVLSSTEDSVDMTQHPAGDSEGVWSSSDSRNNNSTSN